MKKRRVKKSVVKLVLRIVSISIIIYFCITAVSYVVKIKSLSDKEKSLNDELVSLKENEEKLKTDILKLNDKEYIARYAREHYLYTKDGEYTLKIDENDDTKKDVEKKPDYKYIYIASTCAGVILLSVFVLHKKRRKK